MTTTVLEDTARDIRHGIRVLRRAPGFTAGALLTLALGIGATTAIFSIVRTVMLEPLPYREPDRIVTVWETNRGGAARNVIASANFVAWRERTRTLDGLGMVGPAGLTLIVNGQPFEASGLAFSGSLFSTLGVQPALGRSYTAEEDFGGDDTLIVLTHELWQRQLGGRADVLGMTLPTNDGVRTVIGVMPPGFTVVGQKADFLAPYGETLEQLRAASGRGSSYAIARLRNGVSFEQAYADMRAIYAQLEKEAPQRNARRTVMVFPLQEQLLGELRPALFALIGAVALVMLVACVNVANLLLARSAAREREVALRTALGAERRRLVRQMLTESLVLAAAGGIAGLGVAALCLRGLLALVGDRIPIPRLDQVSLDLPVLAFTMVIALATGLAFGLVPAFVSTSHANEALREGGRHGGGRRLHRVLGVPGRRGSGAVAGAARRRRAVDAQPHPAAADRPWLPRGRRADRGRAAAGDALRPAPGRHDLRRIPVAHRRAARSAGRGGRVVSACAVRLHRHQLLAGRCAQAAGWPAVIQSSAAGDPRVLPNAGHSAGGGT